MESVLDQLTRYSPNSEYFAIQGTFESSYGLSPNGRWYGAVIVEGAQARGRARGGMPVRTILDGNDAILAQRAAMDSVILDDADPNPLAECVSTGGMADFTGGGGVRDESHNDPYEMPMDWRDRHAQRHADGRPVIFTPPFGPPVSEDPEESASGWRRVSAGDDKALEDSIILVKSDGPSINVAEISTDDADALAVVRSAIFSKEDLDKFDNSAGVFSGLIDEASWKQAPYWLRAYAKLIYHRQQEAEFPSLEQALGSLGLSEVPKEGP